MINCCNKDNFDYQIKETKEGIQINIAPKDKSKVESFKAMVENCKEFCDL